MIDAVQEIFNNRELAIFAWACLFLIFCLKKDCGKSFIEIIKVFCQKQVLEITFLMGIYISLIISGLKAIGIWGLPDLKGLIYWSLGVGFIMLFKANEAGNDNSYFKNQVINVFKLTIVIEYLIALFVFDFWVELLIFPILMIVSLLHAYCSSHERYKKIEKICANILTAYTLILLVYSIYRISVYDNEIGFVEHARDLFCHQLIRSLFCRLYILSCCT